MTPAPRPYQQHMAEVAVRQNVLLALPPGCGKTRIALMAADSLVFDRLEIDKVLVVGPKVVVEETWPNEVEKWGYGRFGVKTWTAADMDFEQTDRVFQGKVVGRKLAPRDARALRKQILAHPARLHLVSKDNFVPFVVALGKHNPFGLLIIDESSFFSDGESNRYKILCRVLPYLQRIILMNGTPIGNGFEKLYAQMEIVAPGLIAPNLTQFRMRWMEPDKMNPREGRVYSWKPRPGAFPFLVESCRNHLLTLREEDYIALPERVDIDVPVEVPLDEYRRMAEECLLEFEQDEEAVAVNAGVLYGKLSQIASGTVYDTEGNWHELHRRKLEVLDGIIEEHQAPLIVWVNFRSDVARLTQKYPKAAVANRTTDLEKRWNAGNIPLLIAHPDSLGYGVNLQDCPGAGMVWFSVTANAAQYLQAIKRLHRSGRREPVRNWRLVARGTVEEQVMLGRLEERTDWHLDLIEALKYGAPQK